MPKRNNLILTKVAEISKPHGVSGLVHLKLNASLDFFLSLDQFQFEDGQPVEITYKFSKKDQHIFQVSALKNRTDVEDHSKKNILAPCNPRDECDDDEFLYSDLIGSQVLLDNKAIGTIQSLYNAGAHDIVVIKKDSGSSFDVPFISDHFPEIDIDTKKVVIRDESYILFSTLNDE